MEKVEGFIDVGDGLFSENFYCEFETDGIDLNAILFDVELQDGMVESRRYVPERTCKVESSHGYTDAFVQTRYVLELSCHTLDEWPDREPPHFCPICGAKVTRKEAKRNV